MKEGDEAAKRKQKKQKPKMWQQRKVEDVKNEQRQEKSLQREE